MITSTKFFTLYNSNSLENKNREEGSFIMKHMLRNMAHPLAYFLAKHNVSANTASMFMLFFYILSAIVFIFPSYLTIFLAILFFLIADLLDCVDGQLARYFTTYSKNGKVLDSFIHTISSSIFAACFGIRMYLTTNNRLILYVAMIGIVAFCLDSFWLNINNEVSAIQKENNSYLTYLKKGTYIFNDIPLLLLIFFIISYISNFRPEAGLLTLFFFVYVFIIFAEKIIYRLINILNQTSISHGIKWKGWK